MSYLDRLRPASFIAPDSTEFFFLIDSLERSGGKKGATQEILDSGESISQDQGNQTETFTAPIYFPGPDYDLDADPFYAALGQQYSQSNPGILKHPRWGDINVFPFPWSQSEELIDGSQISRIAVTFREVFPQIFLQQMIEALKLLYQIWMKPKLFLKNFLKESMLIQYNLN